ncbi:MAG: beta-N-acetylhexosaminidase [Caulobacteraceae bacterium]|nr:beta-N-acetylhexosaminidase [Caulobacteraceae bacterium]
MAARACILGLEGPNLSPGERAFFQEADPWGFILFARNIQNPDQVRALCLELRATVGRQAPILIDQEGGRVQRLGPPHWRRYPPGAIYGAVTGGEALARLGARLIAHDLHALGIDVDCLPVLDVPVEGAHDIIGDRAYGKTPTKVAAFGRAACEGLLAGGVLPVIKHIPGHGRAFADSHEALPRVDTPLAELRAHDFPPFKALADMPLAMTAHVVYAALDPERPATTSPLVIGQVIREEIGFDGLLMSDDLSMKALSGDFATRTRDSLAAGCDLVLHCNGLMDEMRPIAESCDALEGEALRRADAALARRTAPDDFDAEEGAARLFAGLGWPA